MNSSKTEIESALVDVRKAYRLLYDYQRAALDAAKYVGSQLGIEYQGGYSYFSESAPRDGRGSLDNWAWDWLNLMFYEFHFQREEPKGEWLNLSIWLFSDTGYYVSDHAAPDKRAINTFAPPEKSGTKVGFVLYHHWEDQYHGQLFDTPENLRRFIEKGELPALLKDDGVLGTCYDFSRLADQTSADEVIAELIRLAKSKGFSLERQTKAA
jgi:hypothetical protein